MSIAEVLHIIWIGDETKRPNECIDSWKRLNPTFALRLWGNEELKHGEWRLGKLIERWFSKEINGAADLMRWEILFRHGGVAVDADSVCLRPLEHSLLESEFFAAWENEVVRPGLIATGALGAVAGHPFIKRILDDIENDPDPLGGMAWQKVGPQRLTDTYRAHPHPGVKVYPSHYFLPEHYSGLAYQGDGPVFARQIWATTRRLHRTKELAAANGLKAVPEAQKAPPGGRPNVSLCMIVRNEEANLRACLECCADLVDDIVIVDTGSSDQTKSIAESFRARVFESPWQDSFAAARNESLRHAAGQWIFWMDADDRIDEENRERLKQLFAELKPDMAGYMITCRILPPGKSDVVRLVDHARIFPNHPEVRWKYRVHEQILPAVVRLGGQVRRTDISVCHVGYQDEKLSHQKLLRNLRLMEMDQKDHPSDPFILFNLARAQERLGKLSEAIPLWEKSLALASPQESYVAKTYFLLCEAHQVQGRKMEALQTCLAGLVRFPTDGELLMMAANLLCDGGDLRAAEACLLRLLQEPKKGLTLGDDVGLRTFRARCQLGRIYRDQRRLAESETQWKAALDEKPGYPQALLGLGQVFLDQNRWAELEDIVNRLESTPEGAVEAAVLRGLRLTVTREVQLARQLMEETATKYPRAVEPRILLARLLLRDSRHAERAESVLREILKIEPTNAEASRGLKQFQGKK